MTDLEFALQQINDALPESRRAVLRNAGPLVERVVKLCDTEPLRSLLSGLLPPFNLDVWYAECSTGKALTRGGRAAATFPVDIAEHVACQLALTREATTEPVAFRRYMYLRPPLERAARG